MAEEKILKDEELILDEELDEVVGGTTAEIRDDANRLRALGLLPRDQAVSKQQINDAFWSLGQRYGVSLGYNPDDDNPNRYYLNHEKKNHKEIWNIIYKALGSESKVY